MKRATVAAPGDPVRQARVCAHSRLPGVVTIVSLRALKKSRSRSIKFAGSLRCALAIMPQMQCDRPYVVHMVLIQCKIP